MTTKSVNQAITVSAAPIPVTVTSVTVKTAPTKTAYTEGDSLDLSGLVVTLHKSNNITEDVAFADFATKGITISPANGTGLSTSDISAAITYTADNKSVSQNITVNPAPVVNSATISPTSISYDLKAPADVVTTITWNGASTVIDVVYGTTSLTSPDVYTVSGSALTIKSSYLNTHGASKGNSLTLKISFDKGSFTTLTINVVDSSTPIEPTAHSIILQSSGNGTVSADVYSAAKNTQITLTTAPDTGYRFKEWQVVDGGVTITDNKFTMPDNNVTVKAIFEQIPATEYQVAVNGSFAATSGAGSYANGAIVTINAGSRDGYTFAGWTSADGIIFAKANSATTTFTMPAGNVTVTAAWSYNGSSGGSTGGNSGGSNTGNTGNSTTDDSDTIEVQKELKPDQPIIGSVSVNAKKSTDNSATVRISEKAASNAIAKAQEEAEKLENTENGIGVSLSVSSPVGTKALGIVLTQPTLTLITKAEVSQFEVNSSLGSLNFDLKAIKEIKEQSTGDVTINIIPVTDLNDNTKTLVGSRPVYNISISYVKDGKTVNITTLGSGSVTLSIPYTPGKNEAVGYLFGVYVDGKGNATRIEGSTYDVNSKSIILDSNHFSVYGVGYTAPSEKLKDISSHWAKESIDYVVGRGMLTGTSKTTFSPDTAMTRGMLVTVLGRLADADVSSYTSGSFSDVDSDEYYAPYIEWAYKNCIISGTGDRQFAPDRAVTREELALILANYAKAVGYTLPVTREKVAYEDSSSIGSEYLTAVIAMQQAGIMMGQDGNKFNPKASATRAEVSAMLYRYIKLTIDPSIALGWAQNDAGQYLYYKDGKAFTGWQTIDGTKYYFEADGALKTGWVKDSSSWRYYTGKKAAVGWKKISSDGGTKRYYFTSDGIMVSGKWLKLDGKWYYFNADGSLAVSTKVDGYKVYENGIRITK